MIKPLPQKKQKFGRKLGKILAIVFGVIALGSMAAVIAFSTSKVGDKKLPVGSDSNVSCLSAESIGDNWVYSASDGTLNLCDNELKVVSSVNVVNKLSEKTGLPTSSLHLFTNKYVQNSGNIYTAVTYFNSETSINTDYIVTYKVTDNVLTFNNYGKLAEGCSFARVADDGNTAYISVTDNRDLRCVYRYDADTLAPVGDEKDYAILHSIPYYDADSNIIEIHALKRTNPLYSFDIVGDYIYATTDKGFVKLKADDFSQVKKVYEDFELDASGWDFNKYNFVPPYGQSIVGSELINGTYICTTSDSTISHVSINDFDNVPNEVSLRAYKDIALPASPVNTGTNSFQYNPYTKRAVIVYANVATVSLIDFSDIDKPYLVLADSANINITSAVQTSDNKYLIYVYTNAQETQSSINQIGCKSINDVAFNFLAEKMIVLFVVLMVVFLVLSILALLIWIKNLFLEKFINFCGNVKKNWITYAIMGACIVLLCLFCYYPAVGSISMSFFYYHTGEPVTFNFFRNYIQIFSDPVVWGSFGNMIIFLAMDIITALIPPLIFAFFLTVMRSKKFSALTRTLLFLPAVIPGLTKMMIWQTGIYGDNGIINNIIRAFNGQPVVFFNGGPADIWMLILMGFPFVGSYLVFYGALMNVPSSYYEAAELEGMGVWKRFVRIDVPLIRPQIKYVFVLTFIASVQNFGRTYMITSSTFTLRTPIHLMYEAIQRGDYGYSSAMATILFVLLFVATLFNMRKQKEKLGDAI